MSHRKAKFGIFKFKKNTFHMKADVSYIRVYFYDLGSNFTLTQMACLNLYTDLRATKSAKM